MPLVRRLGVLFLIVLLLSTGIPGPLGAPPPRALRPAALVGWPPSTGLVIAEIVTGGASASDEYVEISNGGFLSVDLVGLELVYVTASGSTVTRKAAWTASLVLDPGRHVLVANASGMYAGLADARYSGGLAATGGSLALRATTTGSVIDAVGWGDAANGFVEGTPAPAPPAGSSIERRPGGEAGNGQDTNDNAADFVVTSLPRPQNAASPPTGPSADPSPTPSPSPSPTPSPSIEPSPTPSPTPGPARVSVAVARTLPSGTAATVEGVLTTDLGALEAGRAGFLQDGTAGIGLYLDAAPHLRLPAGSWVRVSGTVDERYGQRTLRVSEAALEVLGTGTLPDPEEVATGLAGEAQEGRRIAVGGTVVASPTPLAEGLGLSVDDGSGPLRVVVTPIALGDRIITRGAQVVAVGPLGQRDSTGTETTGYRLFVTLPGEIRILPAASPEPSTAPDPTASPTGGPIPSPSAEPTPSPPEAGLAIVPIAAARTAPLGTTLRIRGVVTAEAGTMGGPPLLAVADDTAGIVVRLPAGTQPPARGTLLDLAGSVAEPYGQRELRPRAGAVVSLGAAPLPEPLAVLAAELGEATEGRLVVLTGTVSRSPRRSGNSVVVEVRDDEGGTALAYGAPAAGIDPKGIVAGARFTVTGVVGQHASRHGALDGYRIWLRGADDLHRVASPPPPDEPSAAPSPTAPGSGTGTGAVMAISEALRRPGTHVEVEGTVTAPPGLLDAAGRRIVIEDSGGAIAVLLPNGGPSVALGDRLRVVGLVGQVSGAPQLKAEGVEVLGRGIVEPLELRRAPGPAEEWRLVQATGRIVTVTRLGSGRWRADLAVAAGGAHLLIDGLPGSGIPADSVAMGASLRVVGVVRRPYPTSRDRRFGVVPRDRRDLVLVAAPPSSSGGRNEATDAGGGDSVGQAGGGEAAVGGGGPTDTRLALLAQRVGAEVRVGGLVVDLRPGGFVLDDGTAQALVLLAGRAADLADLVEPGDAVAVAGTVVVVGGRPAVRVDDPSAVVRAADPGAAPSVGWGASAGNAVATALPSPGGDELPGAGSDPRAPGSVPLAFLPGSLGLLVGLVTLLVMTEVGRRRDRRRLLGIVRRRLSALAGGNGGSPAVWRFPGRPGGRASDRPVDAAATGRGSGRPPA